MSEPDVADFLASRQIDLVFDVGANTGQYGSWLRERGYRGRIISFEPIAEVFAHLERSARDDALWDVHRFALGAEPGSAEINVSRSTDFSSILPVRAAARTFDENATVARTETIEIRTLDDVAADLPPSRRFLKIDTQGFEREVLAGAGRTLAELQGVQLEVPVVHLYEGSWTMSEALDTMAGHGFVLSLASVVNHHSRDPCAVVEFDCVFRRRSAIDD
jgi:FkbM family methyltransferase